MCRSAGCRLRLIDAPETNDSAARQGQYRLGWVLQILGIYSGASVRIAILEDYQLQNQTQLHLGLHTLIVDLSFSRQFCLACWDIRVAPERACLCIVMADSCLKK